MKRKIKAIIYGFLLMTVSDLFLGNILHIHFLATIAFSVFIGAAATGAIVKDHRILFGTIVGVLTALISFLFYLQAKNGIDEIPFMKIFFPISISIISGAIGGYVGGFLSHKFNNKNV
jgi:putative membrane protein (TIGR04086 family)